MTTVGPIFCGEKLPGGFRCVSFRGHRGPHSPATVEASEPLIGLAEQVSEWWRARAESEIEQTVAKATEYSGTGGGLPQDLVSLGREWMFAAGDNREYTDAELAEVGVWTFVVGKLGRWSSALRNGRMVSDDTLLDIGIYVRIVQRIREVKQWP